MKVDTCAESLATGYTITLYVWIFQIMSEIEPRWKLSQIKLIFADNSITDKLLSEIGIIDT